MRRRTDGREGICKWGENRRKNGVTIVDVRAGWGLEPISEEEEENDEEKDETGTVREDRAGAAETDRANEARGGWLGRDP